MAKNKKKEKVYCKTCLFYKRHRGKCKPFIGYNKDKNYHHPNTPSFGKFICSEQNKNNNCKYFQVHPDYEYYYDWKE